MGERENGVRQTVSRVAYFRLRTVRPLNSSAAGDRGDGVSTGIGSDRVNALI